MPNIRKTNYIKISIICMSAGLLASCGVLQSNHIEDMEKNERLAFLLSKTDTELCRYYNNSLIKQNTEKQVKEILQDRKIDECQNMLGIRSIKQEAAQEVEKITPILTGNVDQIEVMGLIPGKTTKAQLNDKKILGTFLIIGGYKLICDATYIEGFLSSLGCFTGEKSGSFDATVTPNERASNTKIHATLLRGFSKKFGPPLMSNTSIVSNNFGVKFENHSATWIDKNGNALQINSIASKIDQGAISLLSAEEFRKFEAEKNKSEQKRKF